MGTVPDSSTTWQGHFHHHYYHQHHKEEVTEAEESRIMEGFMIFVACGMGNRLAGYLARIVVK